MLLELIKNSVNNINMIYFIDINQNVIQIDNHNDVKHLGQKFIDIALETCWCIKQAKEHYLVLQMTVSNLKFCLSLICFANSHSMVNSGYIRLRKMFSLI